MSHQDQCDCHSGCCQPKTQNPLWKKAIFLLIIILALGLVLKKLTTKDEISNTCCDADNHQQTSCCKSAVEQDTLKIIEEEQ